MRQARADVAVRSVLARWSRQRNARPEQGVWTSRAFRRARKAALARDGHRCRECGWRADLTVHHIVALRDGGSATALENLVVLCRRCHGAKTGGGARVRRATSDRA